MSPEPVKGSASNPAPATPAASSERGAASFRYVDRADMVETFADSVTGLIFDGQTLRHWSILFNELGEHNQFYPRLYLRHISYISPHF